MPERSSASLNVSAQVPGAPRILGLRLNAAGSLLLALCNDRVIRLYEVNSARGPAEARETCSADAVKAKVSSARVRSSSAARSQSSRCCKCQSLWPGAVPCKRPCPQGADAQQRRKRGFKARSAACQGRGAAEANLRLRLGAILLKVNIPQGARDCSTHVCITACMQD